MDFREQVKECLQGLDRKQIRRFTWLCGVRALPFLSAGRRAFVYWPEDSRQKHLHNVFRALDIAYADTDADAAVYAANNAARAARAARADGDDAYAYAYAAARAARAAARAAARTYDDDAADADADAAAYADDAYTYAAVYAADAKIDRHRFEELLLNDIKAIKTGNLSSLNNDTIIYGKIWQNFLDDLNSAGCGYWARLYVDLFHNRFEPNVKELNRRLSVPEEIREQGAAAVGSYFDKTSLLQIPTGNITETPKEDKTTKTATASPDVTERNKTVTNRTEVFISYSHKDEAYIDELNIFLKLLSTNFGVKIWYDKMLKTGDEWKKEIREHLSKAKVAVLMISKNFLVSEFILNEELPDLLQAADNENATIMWVPLTVAAVSDVRIKGNNNDEIRISKYQAVCDPKKPLSNMGEHERDEVYNKLYEEIKHCFGYHE